MYSSGSSSLFDTIIRTCKNAAGETIAVQRLSVIVKTVGTENVAGQNLVTVESLDTRRFKRTGIIKLVQSRPANTSLSDRTVATVDVEGSFSSYTLDSNNDVTTVTYTSPVTEVNDLTLPVNTISGIIQVGASV